MCHKPTTRTKRICSPFPHVYVWNRLMGWKWSSRARPPTAAQIGRVASRSRAPLCRPFSTKRTNHFHAPALCRLSHAGPRWLLPADEVHTKRSGPAWTPRHSSAPADMQRGRESEGQMSEAGVDVMQSTPHAVHTTSPGATGGVLPSLTCGRWRAREAQRDVQAECTQVTEPKCSLRPLTSTRDCVQQTHSEELQPFPCTYLQASPTGIRRHQDKHAPKLDRRHGRFTQVQQLRLL